MGKRSKNRDNMTAAGMVEITDSNTGSEEKLEEEKNSILKKINHKAIGAAIYNIKKMKSCTDQGLMTENKKSDNIEENDSQTCTHKGKKKRKEMEADKGNTTDNSTKLLNKHNEIPKKIKFGDDGEPDLDMKKNEKEKSYLNDEERAIHDDDIDQFCNDIDDEDNKQYESWISLLEQKLGSSESNTSNKKKRRKKKDNNKSTV